MASTDALPVPKKGVAYRVIFPILDADGDLVTGAATLDSEVSKDQGTFADCTNEATEIATASGMYYLDLTATEMTADCVAVIVKTGTAGAKTTPIVLYPQEADDIRVDVQYWLGTAAATPTVAGVPEVDVTHWLGTAAATPTVAGVPEVDVTHVQGATTVPTNLTVVYNTDFAANYDTVLDCWNVDVEYWKGTAVATPSVAGVPEVDVTHWIGSGVAIPSVGGVPEVDITHLGGIGQSLLDLKDFADDGYDPTTNKVQGVVLTDTTTTVTNTVSANTIQISGDTTAADNLELAFDDTAGAVPWTRIVDQGTAQSATGTTLVLRAAAGFADDELNGATITITGGTTGVGQSKIITDYVGATDTATVSTWAVTPTGTITYKITGTAEPTATFADVNVVQWNGSAVAVPTVAGVPEVDVTHWIGTAAATPTVAGVPEVDVTHVQGATTVPTNLTVVYNTDFAANYDTTLDQWKVDVESWDGFAVVAATVAGVPEVDVTHWVGATTVPTNVTVVFNTDFATNYDATLNQWTVNTASWNGTAVATPTVAGVPEVDLTHIKGSTTVDGVDIVSLIESIISVLFGKATVAGSVISFKKRDGTTEKVSVTVGATPGERTASTIT